MLNDELTIVVIVGGAPLSQPSLACPRLTTVAKLDFDVELFALSGERLLDRGPVIYDVGLTQHVNDVGSSHCHRLFPAVGIHWIGLAPPGLARARVPQKVNIVLVLLQHMDFFLQISLYRVPQQIFFTLK